MKRISSAIFSILALGAYASAQSAPDMKQEITVDRTIEPNERMATRISTAAPSILSFQTRPITLNQAEYLRSSTLSPSLSFLEPAAWRDTIDVTPWRGYAGIGYFPLYNLWATAGIKFIDNAKTKANAWAQYDGFSYKSRLAPDYNPAFNSHQFNVGAHAEHNVNATSKVKANLGLIFDSRNTPYIHPDNKSPRKTAFGAKIDATWSSSFKAVDYYGQVRLDYFAFGKNALYCFEAPVNTDITQVNALYKARSSAAKEFVPGFSIGGKYNIKSIGHLSVDISGDYVFANKIYETDYTLLPGANAYTETANATLDFGNYGITSFHPQLRIKQGALTVSAGFVASLYGHGGTHINFAPDVRAAYDITKNASAFVNFTGGMEHSTLRRIFEISPYAGQSVHYQPENAPVIVDFGLNFGPIKQGLGVSVSGGFNVVHDYLTPVVIPGYLSQLNIFSPTNINGWHAALQAHYTFRKLLQAHFGAETASQGFRKGYAPWRDKAKYVVSMGIEAYPINKLTVGAEWQLRAQRRGYTLIPGQPYIDADGNEAVAPSTALPFNLRNISNLKISASYKLNTQLTIFARGENLLNRCSGELFGIPSQKIHGLLGVTYKL